MNRIFELITREHIWTLVFRIVAVNIVFSIFALVAFMFLDLEVLQSEIPIISGISGQFLVIIFVAIMEVLIIGAIIIQWVLKRKPSIPIEILLEEGESDSVEFKSSLRWDLKNGKVNKDLEYAIARSVAGFMNTNGGTLIIGVDDGKKIVGLEADYITLKKQNSDGFLLHLSTVVANHLGKEYLKFTTSKIEKIEGKEVCVVTVDPSPAPIYVKRDNNEEFFIRSMASTQPMNTREAHEYIDMHWKDKK